MEDFKSNLPNHIRLIGSVGYSLLCKKMEGDETSSGQPEGNLLISRFSKEMVAALVFAAEEDQTRAPSLQFCLDRDEMHGLGLKNEHLTDENAVGVRSWATEGKFFVSAEFETETQSNSSTACLDSQDLEEGASAPLWVDSFETLCLEILGHEAFGSSEQKDHAKALISGLFSLHRVSLVTAAKYIWEVFSLCRNNTLKKAAGLSLPYLFLPLFEDCFDGVKETQPSAWRNKLESHWRNDTYLRKRDDKYNHLEKKDLLTALNKHEGIISEDLKRAFGAYAYSKTGLTEESKKLFFEFDWSDVNEILSGAQKATVEKTGVLTKRLFAAENTAISQDDEDLLDRLDTSRKSVDDEELREFFDQNRNILEQDPGVYKRWEKLVYDKEVTCSNLWQGIIECLEKSSRGGESLGKPLSIQLIGIGQDKPNSFREKNKAMCQYFEHQYRSLEGFLKNRLFFLKTHAHQYTQNVFIPHLNKKKFKLKSTAKKNCSLEFRLRVIAKDAEKIIPISEHKLVWRFDLNSVLSGYLDDLDRLSTNTAGTALIECAGDRDAAGSKGLPNPLSLMDVGGFQDGPTGKGTFVPAKMKGKQHSLIPKWEKALKGASNSGIVSNHTAVALQKAFENFNDVYSSGIKELSTDQLANIDGNLIANLYGSLLESVARIGDESARRRLMKPLLQIGTVQISASLGEEIATLICPWHPIRIQANQARNAQFAEAIMQLLSPQRGEFCDDSGNLFFSDLKQLATHPQRPEIAVGWEGANKLKPVEQIASQALEAYSFHNYPFSAPNKKNVLHDDSQKPAEVIRGLVEEYLRLQPHERDNLSIALYNSDSTTLPIAVVEQINKLNESRKGKSSGTEADEITCQVLMTHGNQERLRETYKSLLSRASDPDELLGTEVTGEFLSRVRINIIAASNIPSPGKAKPVDIAVCQDVISRKAAADWHRLRRTNMTAEEILPHQWGRRDTVTVGSDVSRLFLCCPAQPKAGWQYLLGVASVFVNEAIDSWENGKCHVLTRKIDFSEEELGTIFKETHRIATWVANYDELLDRRLLEAKKVKVIRYEQNTTNGRNLVISSEASNAFLEAALREKVAAILGSGAPANTVTRICERSISDANLLSGGLVLKAARRIKNTHELLGCVLSRFIVAAQLNRPVLGTAWCMLDDYAIWLGKKPETGIADILALSPVVTPEGGKHLDVIVSEAKFVDYDSLPGAKKKSENQLADTVAQFQRAASAPSGSIDKKLVLARISELLANNLRSISFQDAEEWKAAIRSGECSIRVRGLSHVFCHGPKDNLSQKSTFTAITKKNTKESFQEIFNHIALRDLLLAYGVFDADAFEKVQKLRLSSGAALDEIGSPEPSKAHKDENTKPAPEQDQEDSPDKNADSAASTIPKPIEDFEEEEELNVTSDAESFDKKHPETPIEVSAPSSVFELLNWRVNHFSEADDETEQWVEDISSRTRSAFINRGMAFLLVRDPILSPNSLIFKIKGTKEVTTASILKMIEEIKTTDGVDILSVVSEVGQISVAVRRSPRAILRSEVMFFRYLEDLRRGNVKAHDIPVAIREDDNSVVYLRPFEQPHSLVAGATGSGKSVLLRNIITAITLGQTPDEAQIFLIDAKGGLDFACLFDLPHIQEYDGVKLVEEPGQALSIFEKIISEMDERYQLFKKAGTDNLMNYRKKTGNTLPILWIVHDEFGIWMQDGQYRKDVEPLINTLAKKARAAGIFLILADQRPDNTVFPMQTRSNLDNRLALKVTDKGTSKIALELEGAEKLLKHGHMLAKTADYPIPVFCQVPFIETEAILPLIEAIASQE